MATTASGLVVPTAGDIFDPAGDMVDLANSLRSRIVVPVANVTGRAALLAAIDWTPSPSEPLRVNRADATPGREQEYTTDGTTWLSVAGGTDTGWTTIPVLAAWNASSAQYRIIDGIVYLRGYLRPTTGSMAAGNVSSGIGTLPLAARPAAGLSIATATWVAGGNPSNLTRGVLGIATTGVLTVINDSTGAATGVMVDGVTYPLG